MTQKTYTINEIANFVFGDDAELSTLDCGGCRKCDECADKISDYHDIPSMFDGFDTVALPDGTTIEFVDQEGGGEGGSSYCYSVVKINEDFYMIEYNYYSHYGYDYDGCSYHLVEQIPYTAYQYKLK